jgi:hypothetical protein
VRAEAISAAINAVHQTPGLLFVLVAGVHDPAGDCANRPLLFPTSRRSERTYQERITERGGFLHRLRHRRLLQTLVTGAPKVRRDSPMTACNNDSQASAMDFMCNAHGPALSRPSMGGAELLCCPSPLSPLAAGGVSGGIGWDLECRAVGRKAKDSVGPTRMMTESPDALNSAEEKSAGR